MPPYQQQNQNPYDFILNAGQGPQRGGPSKAKRILIVAVLGMLLLTIGIVVMGLLSSAGKEGRQTLLSIAQQQEELVRVADMGTQKARSPIAQNLAITTKLSIASAQKDLLDYMRAQGIKTGPKELALGKNSKTDDELTAAEQNNRYDEALTATLQKQLNAYQNSLRKAHSEAAGKSGKELLSTAYNHAGLLLNKPENQPAGS